MAGGGSPRQKMINMMYLVLTAMLALNVSAEILRAFSVVEQGLAKTGKGIDEKNKISLSAIEEAYKQRPARAQKAYDDAREADKLTKDMIKYMEDLKASFADVVNREEDGQLKEAKDMEVHAHVLLPAPGQGKGEELRKRMETYFNKLISFLPADQQADFKKTLPIPEQFPDKSKPNVDWSTTYFDQTPRAAVVALFNAWENDVRNAYADALAKISASIDAKAIKVDQVAAKVVPNLGTYIMVGQEYTADIFLAAFNSKSSNDVFVNGNKIPVEAGMGKFKIPVTSEGEKKFTGYIVADGPEGPEKKEFELSFTGFSPNATISADKMNVLYRGLKNPMTVAVPGVAPGNLIVDFGGTPYTGSNGKYIVSPSGTATVVRVSVSVKGEKGVKSMGVKEFRVKPLPKPYALYGTVTGGEITTGQANLTNAIVATLGPDFAFEGLKFRVTGYKITVVSRKGGITSNKVTGGSIPPDAKRNIANVRSGDLIVIENIQAAPTGDMVANSTPVTLPSGIILNIKN